MRRMIRKTNILVLAAALFYAGIVSAAIAQSALNSGTFDTNQPLEIMADSLEVQQDKQLAIFEGNVQVEQGEIRMRANKLVVHYSDSKSSKNDTPANIRQIDATGNVFLSSPRETAQGDKGVYDVTNKHIDLQGNVILTQGKNVLRGDKMTLNLITGKSRVEGGPVTEGSKGRVKGIFIPEKKTEE